MANLTTRIASFLGDLSISRKQDWKLNKSWKTELTPGNLRRRLSNTISFAVTRLLKVYAREAAEYLVDICMTSQLPYKLELSENLRDLLVDLRINAIVRSTVTCLTPKSLEEMNAKSSASLRSSSRGRVRLSPESGKFIDVVLECKPADLAPDGIRR
ncbi:hypothetical protein KCU89_g160, partial [Aureobasidium melanogenum]